MKTGHAMLMNLHLNRLQHDMLLWLALPLHGYLGMVIELLNFSPTCTSLAILCRHIIGFTSDC